MLTRGTHLARQDSSFPNCLLRPSNESEEYQKTSRIGYPCQGNWQHLSVPWGWRCKGVYKQCALWGARFWFGQPDLDLESRR